MSLYAVGHVPGNVPYLHQSFASRYPDGHIGLSINIKKAVKDIGTGIKNTANKAVQVVKKVSLAVPRGAFLGLMKLNGLNSAHNIGIAWNRGHKDAILKLWKTLGGDEKQFKIALIMGVKHWNATKHAQKLHSYIDTASMQGLPRFPAHIGDGGVSAAALIAAAGTVLAAFAKLLAGLKKQDKDVSTDTTTYEDTGSDTADTDQSVVNAANEISKAADNAVDIYQGRPVKQPSMAANIVTPATSDNAPEKIAPDSLVANIHGAVEAAYSAIAPTLSPKQKEAAATEEKMTPTVDPDESPISQFIEKYKTPLLFGGGLLALALLLKK